MKELTDKNCTSKDIEADSTYLYSGNGKNKIITRDKSINKNVDELEKLVDKSSLFDLDWLHSKFEYLDILGKISLSFLMLHSVILSCLITKILILYGNFLIKKFNLNEKYPKLAKFIELRIKFQRYYLIFIFTFIFIVLFTDILFLVAILI